MSSQTVYLITGAARGVGLAIVTQLASKSGNVVFAGVRNVNLEAGHPLAKLVAEKPEVVQLVKITSADKEDNLAAAQAVKEKYGKVDVIIANAGKLGSPDSRVVPTDHTGVSSGVQPISTVSAETIQADFTINTIGPLVLFQSFAPLLESSDIAKFVVISSMLGQVTESLPWPHNAYGLSKAAVNFIVKKIDQETEGVIAFPIHPGLVATDMAQSVADQIGTKLEDLGAISPEASAAGVLAVVDAATKESHGGKFWNYDGSALTY